MSRSSAAAESNLCREKGCREYMVAAWWGCVLARMEETHRHLARGQGKTTRTTAFRPSPRPGSTSRCRRLVRRRLCSLSSFIAVREGAFCENGTMESVSRGALDCFPRLPSLPSHAARPDPLPLLYSPIFFLFYIEEEARASAY